MTRTSGTTGAILGTFDVTWLTDDAESRNRRLYPKDAVQAALEQAERDLDAGIPLTTYAWHPDGLAGDPSRMTGRVQEVWRDGAKVKATIALLNTAAGRDMAAVVAGGGLKTVSLRSRQNFKARPIERNGEAWTSVEAFELDGIDFAVEPGIPDVEILNVALESAAARTDPAILCESFALDDDDTAYTPLTEDTMPRKSTAPPAATDATDQNVENAPSDAPTETPAETPETTETTDASETPQGDGSDAAASATAASTETPETPETVTVPAALAADGPTTDAVMEGLLARIAALEERAQANADAATPPVESAPSESTASVRRATPAATPAATDIVVTEDVDDEIDPYDAWRGLDLAEMILSVNHRLNTATSEEIESARAHIENARQTIQSVFGDAPTESTPSSTATEAAAVTARLTEAVEAGESLATRLTEAETQAGDLRTQLTEARARVTQAEADKAAADTIAREAGAKLDNALKNIIENWRPNRRVPIDAIAATVLGEDASADELSEQAANPVAVWANIVTDRLTSK